MTVLKGISYTCYALSVLSLVTAVVLFFKLKIRETYYELSGKAQKDIMKRMTETYAATGSLRANTSEPTSAEMARERSINESLMMTGPMKQSGQKIRKVEKAPRVGGENGKKRSGKLHTGLTGATRGAGAKNFRITKDVIVIHTEERIP